MKRLMPPKHAVLRKIADALGVPVEHFFTDRPSTKADATTDECLHLWGKITTEAGQRQALEALRTIADDESREE